MNQIAAYGGFPQRYPHWRFGIGVRAAPQAAPLRPGPHLRDGHQQRPLLRLPAGVQPAGRPEAGDRPRLRPQRLLQEQPVVQPDQPQDDGRDGQPRHPRPQAHREARVRHGREVAGRLPEPRAPDRPAQHVHAAAARSTPPKQADQPRGAAADEVQGQGLPGPLDQPAGRAWRPRRRSSRTSKAKTRHATPARPTRDVLLYLLEHARLEDWQADCLGDRPRGELLLRPAGHDQGNERGVGQLLAQHADDQALRRGQGNHRLRRPPQRHRPHAAGEFQPVQDRHRAVPRHRRPLEQGQVRQGVRGGRQPRGRRSSGTRGWAWAARRSSRSGGSTTT